MTIMHKKPNRQLLTNRNFTIAGNWYEPRNFLKENFKSVVSAGYFDTTSSAGDWTGYFVQKIKNNYYLILFSQENRAFGGTGFDLKTFNSVHSEMNYLPDEEEIFKMIEEQK